MKKNIINPLIFWGELLFCMLILSSCSSDDYQNVIPKNSTAVISVDLQELYNTSDDKQLDYLKDVLKLKDADASGLDFSTKAYVFETVDGNIGLVAKVDDEDNISNWIKKLEKAGYCKNLTTRKGFKFTSVKDTWILGFSSDALLVMGPILPIQQADMQRQMIKFLEQDDSKSIKGSPMFQKLDSLESSVSMVAQAAALPEKFVAPFTIGAPKDADASQIMIAAEFVKGEDGCVNIKGETYSLNEHINNAIKENKKTFRPIRGTYSASMPINASLGIFLNVDGKEFLKLLHSNNSIQALLAGMNTAIDMDNIIKSINGDMSIIIHSFNEGGNIPQMSAQLSNNAFLKDIGYWRESCLAGCKIIDWNKNSYYYTNGTFNYYFGVSDDMQFYSGGSPKYALESISKSQNAIPEYVQNKIRGKRLCLILNLETILGDGTDKASVMTSIKPLLGNIRTVIFSM